MPKKAPKIHKERIDRNIKFKYLDLTKYYRDENCREINRNLLEKDVERIGPQMMIMVLCYSRIQEFKFILESKGIFSELRLKRELNLQSKGKILTMNKIQKEFLQTIATEENIEKRIVHIEGKVGSGKTLLGIEVMKMKLAHYFMKYKLKVNHQDGLKKLRVIILADDPSAALLMDQLSKELPEDIGLYCSITVQSKPILKGVLRQVVQDTEFTHCIVMIDECFHDNFECYILEDQNIDFIHCIL